MTKPKLKRCPFCGGKAIITTFASDYDLNEYHFSRCKKCGVRQIDHVHKLEAIANWNRRAKEASDGKP